MKKIPQVKLNFKSPMDGYCHLIYTSFFQSKLVKGIILVFILNLLSLIGWAQPAASWNYGTQTGTLGTTYSWIDCSDGTDIITGDDTQASVSWPFNFIFYNNSYTTANSLSVATNGFIRLDGIAAGTDYNAATTYRLSKNATDLGQIIATSIYDCSVGHIESSWVKYLVTGTAPNRILTIEYNDIEIDYNDGLYADVQVSFYETLNKIVLKLGSDNITAAGVDMGIHSGVKDFFNKWQEVQSGTNNTWIEYMPSIEVNATIGTSLSYYSTLKDAFDKINDGTHRGAVTIKINTNTTETSSAVLNGSGSGSASYTSVNIYPTTTGLSIIGNLNAPLINLDGADNVTIDGRVNATGTTKDLIISNTRAASVPGTSTIQFINGATNNTVQYSTIKGSETRPTSGVIFFSTSTATTGSNNNNIFNNTITNANDANRPVNAIYSLGTLGKENRDNTISGNDIYDFLKHASASNGIFLSSNTTAWTISGNSFYETSSFVPLKTVTYYAIQINNTSGNDFNILGNYIGGSASQCGGTAWTKTSAMNNLFYAIRLSVNNTSASSINNNTIKNFSWSNSENADWTGISVAAGSVNIGTVAGNTIGDATGTGSITFTGATSGQTFYGIDLAGNGTIVCSNNTIGSVTVANSNSANASNFYGINRTNTGTSTFSNNTIGSPTQANSIIISSASTGNAQSAYGIRNTTGGSVTFDNNIICNLTNGTTNTTTSTLGVITGIISNTGINTITNNTIFNLSIANANSSPYNSASVTGIAVSSTNELNTISGNTIYNLSNTYDAFTGSVIGLYFGSTGISHTVTGNFIHSLSITGASATSASIYGIKIFTGQTTYANNIISLGGNAANTLYGIYEYGTATNDNSIYFNTVYINGSLGSGVTNKSYAFYTGVATNVRDFRNNIFVNERSTVAGSNLHYAAYFSYSTSTSLTVDYNDYYVTGTGGVLGYYGANKTILPIVTDQDLNSLSIDPVFANAGGLSASDYYTSAVLQGVTGTGITADFYGLTRSGTPQMGALEPNNYVWQGSISTDFGTAGNWVGGVVPPDGADINFVANPDRSCVLDQNRTVKNITNTQAIDYFVVNGHQLTITGNLVFSNGAKIDATSASSVLVFEGDAAQNIPLGALVNNTTDGLTINNGKGLTLNDDLIIPSNLTLTIGALNIGANTLTLNGSVTTISGLLVGGSLSNIIIGGSGTSTTLPAVTLNNLTLNRSNGIVLGGDLNIGGILNLTGGTLNLGSYILTISGSSPLRTSGNIDASNANATILFDNSSAITLPASIFTGAINNFTLSGSGGVTASGDFSINGILNLQSANPSATKGILDIWDGSEAKTLTMGANSTTIGNGDVTGIVARNYFTSGVQYSFGSQHTNISFVPGGTFPNLIKVKITIGTPPAWKPDAINRLYDFVQSGGVNCFATISSRYLESELNGIDENYLSQWTFGANGQQPEGAYDWGFTNYDAIENWVEIADVNIAYFPTAFGDLESTLATSAAEYVVWNGSASTDWENSTNWTPNTVPNTLTYVVIPDAETTPNDPLLPAIAEINNIWLQLGSVLNSNINSVLTLTGNLTWINAGGTFVPSTGTVVLSNTTSNVSGKTSFYNLTIPATTTTWLSLASYIKIAGALTNNGSLRTVIAGETTVEYNGLGNQTVIIPNSSTNRYSNLILSGSGTKTLPASSLDIVGSFSVLDSAITTAAESLNISGNFIVGLGASFTTGVFNHSIGGNLDCNGTFIASAGSTITFNGTGEQSVFGNTLTFENLTINNSSTVNLYTDLIVNDALTLTSGTLSVGETTLTINSSLVQTGGLLSVTDLSSLYFGGTSALTLPSSLFSTTPSINNLTINRAGGVTFSSNLTVNGILNLQSGNPSSTLGSLNMGIYTLDMGGSATTIGAGDVTGIVRRTSIVPNIEYSFGNKFLTITFEDFGTLPTEISAKTYIGVAPSWKTGAINRTYDVIQVGGSGTHAILKAPYLDSELNGNIESKLVDWSYRYATTMLTEHGRSNFNSTENWVAISNANVAFFASTFGALELTLDESELTALTWNGSVSTSWVTTANWTPEGAPSDNTVVIIPDAATTANDPLLPATATCGTITIESGGILNSSTNAQFTLNGASGVWSNQNGTFNAGSSTVIFTNPAAIINGITDFNNITVNSGASLTLTTNSITRIAGTLSNSGIVDAGLFESTLEYNGTDQTVLNLNGTLNPGYHNLILSGSGTKTMPSTPMSIHGNFTILGTVTATAAESLTIRDDLTIENGATFATGSFDHSIGGNVENNGTFTVSAGETITLNGTSVQNILGTSTVSFENLIVDNISGVSLSKDISVNGALQLTNGNLEVAANTLTLNGSLTSTAGFIDVSNLSSLTFSGTSAITIPNDIFTIIPTINNLTVNCSGGVSLGNQDITIDGLLDLTSGTLSLGSNTLIIAGLSPVRTTGTIDASIATIQFTNAAAIVLPASIFSGSVNNFTISGTGGVTSSGDISLIGILDLQSVNPSATKGTLDMSTNTFNMGELSHVIGVGDVTGIVKREHTFNNHQEYCFGNEYTRITFLGVTSSTKPTWVSCKIEIGTAPEWRTLNVKRIYSFLQSGGDDRTYVRLHYLDSELDALETDESKIIMYTDKDGLSTGDNTVSLGKTSNDITDNWVELVGMAINKIATSSTTFAKDYGLGYTNVSKITWTGAGSVSYPGDWSLPGNWLGGVPSATDTVLIPTGLITTYPYRNLLTGTSPAVAKTIEIESGATLTMNSFDLTIYGATNAWVNNGTFTPGTGTVYFANGSTSNIATIAGTTNFYNLRVEPNTYIQPATGSIIRIESEIIFDVTSILDFASKANTIEFNGADQTIVNPNGPTPGYYNLNLSGSGNKTLPSSTMDIAGDLAITGTASATAGNNLNVDGNLAIASVCNLSIAPTTNMTVLGTITNSAGNSGLVLKSDATGTASLIHNTDNVNATVERYISGAAEDWHFLSSPVVGQAISGTWLPSGTYGNGTGYDLYLWNEPTSCWIYKLNTTSLVNWTTVHPGSNFEVGRGYLYSVQATNPSKSFAGDLNNGTVSYGLTIGGTDLLVQGFNLVGNPYASSIDWMAASGWTRDNLVPSGGGNDMWIWNPEAKNYGVYNSADVTGVGTNDVTRYIPSMQGFFVRAETAGNLQTTNDVRVHDATTLWKSGHIDPNRFIAVVNSETDQTFDEVRLLFGYPENKAGAAKLFSPVATAPSLYLAEGESNLTIRYLSDTIANPHVPLLFKAGQNGYYTINFDFNNFDINIAILEDQLTGEFTDLTLDHDYRFSASKSDNENRFIIHFGAVKRKANLELPAKIYVSGGVLVIDLTLVDNYTKVMVVDVLGRIILQKNLNGNSIHRLGINVRNQIVIVTAKTNKAMLTRKVFVP